MEGNRLNLVVSIKLEISHSSENAGYIKYYNSIY